MTRSRTTLNGARRFVMISRLFIIVIALMLPIVIALLSQRMASTIEPPVLPTSPVEVKLLSEKARGTRRNDQPDDGNDAPVRYVPRVIDTNEPEKKTPPSTESGASRARFGNNTEGR